MKFLVMKMAYLQDDNRCTLDNSQHDDDWMEHQVVDNNVAHDGSKSWLHIALLACDIANCMSQKPQLAIWWEMIHLQ